VKKVEGWERGVWTLKKARQESNRRKNELDGHQSSGGGGGGGWDAVSTVRRIGILGKIAEKKEVSTLPQENKQGGKRSETEATHLSQGPYSRPLDRRSKSRGGEPRGNVPFAQRKKALVDYPSLGKVSQGAKARVDSKTQHYC